MPGSKGSSKSRTSKATPAAEGKTKPRGGKKQETVEERLATLRKNLIERRDEILVKAQERNRVFEINAHGDLVDQSTDLSERELRMGMAEHDRRNLTEIDEALSRIDVGEYGICATCGCEISMGRLTAIPTATLCVPCKQRLELEESAEDDSFSDFKPKSTPEE